MNFEYLNQMVKYIEENLTRNIEYKKLAKIVGVSEYNLQRIFVFLTNMSLAEYIRKRRLSMSAIDLIEGKEKIIDIAIKYNYESSQAYSRALKKMMGFEPSNIKNNQGNIKFFAQYELTNEELTEEFNYQFNNKLFKVFFCFGG